MIARFLSLLDSVANGMGAMSHWGFGHAAPLPKPRIRDRILAAFVLLIPVWMVLVIIMGFVEKSSAEDLKRTESVARIEQLQAEERDVRNEAYRLRFLALFEFDDYRTVQQGFPFRRDRQRSVGSSERIEALGMNQFDLEAIRAGQRPVSAREMINLCEYREMALSDCLNLDYPLTFAQRKDLGGVSVARWLDRP